MSIEEQRRTMVLTGVVAGSVSMVEAAALLGLSERSVWRLKRRFLAEGPAGLVHGNRGRPSSPRFDERTRARIVEQPYRPVIERLDRVYPDGADRRHAVGERAAHDHGSRVSGTGSRRGVPPAAPRRSRRRPRAGR